MPGCRMRTAHCNSRRLSGEKSIARRFSARLVLQSESTFHFQGPVALCRLDAPAAGAGQALPSWQFPRRFAKAFCAHGTALIIADHTEAAKSY